MACFIDASVVTSIGTHLLFRWCGSEVSIWSSLLIMRRCLQCTLLGCRTRSLM